MTRVTYRPGPGVDRQALQAGALDGVRAAVEHLLGESRRLVPIEEGTLERSGTASAETTDTGAHGAVSFDTVYAVRQHEELTWQHDPGRQAKYLEQPYNREAGTMRDLIATAMRRRLTGG